MVPWTTDRFAANCFRPSPLGVKAKHAKIPFMHIEVLGVGNAFTAMFYNTSFLVRSQRLYLIDCPQSLFRLLRERGVPLPEVNHVIVTHIHGDHTAGLETLLLWKKYAERRRVAIFTSSLVWRELRERFFPRFSTTFAPGYARLVETRFEDYAEFRELREETVNWLDEELRLEIRHNWHPTPTLGLKLQSPWGSVGISGDTCYRPSLLRKLVEEGKLDSERYRRLAGDWLWEADLIYHEADRHEPSPHTLEKDLLGLPSEIVRKIRLIHYPDDFAEGPVPLAREGEKARFSERGGISLE
jgi:ribonuclease BN (tRNA processing enzyme)